MASTNSHHSSVAYRGRTVDAYITRHGHYFIEGEHAYHCRHSNLIKRMIDNTVICPPECLKIMKMDEMYMIPPPPPARPKPDMSWTNLDWMRTYGAVNTLIHVYNNELSSGHRHEELKELKLLRSKLETMFRDGDDE